MSESYLILHKVRGEPAFDVAVRIKIGDEDGWIIPTSGHRAYPARVWALEDLADVSDYPHNRLAYCKASLDDLPDHYQSPNWRPAKRPINLEELGL
jgi:hypothetical protein